MIDVRVGWDVDQLLEETATLEELGVSWIVSNVIGDDAAASEETIRRFGEEIVKPARGAG